MSIIFRFIAGLHFFVILYLTNIVGIELYELAYTIN